MYSEARGQSIDGVIAIGEAAATRARKTKTDICKVTGVTRKHPERHVKDYYKTLADHILKTKQTPLSLGADSWNRGTKPAYEGQIKRQIGPHVLYVMK